MHSPDDEYHQHEYNRGQHNLQFHVHRSSLPRLAGNGLVLNIPEKELPTDDAEDDDDH